VDKFTRKKNSLRKHYKQAHSEEYKILCKNYRHKPRKPFDKFNDLLECIKCEYIATSKSTLDGHQRKCHPEYRESRRESIKEMNKKRYKHDKPVDDPNSNDDSPHSSDSSDSEYRTCVYKCQICKNNFKTEPELNIHQQKNHQEYYRMRQISKQAKLEEFKCKICEKQFTRKQRLQQHMFMHTGDHPFKCEVCKQGFSDASKMKKHMKSHDKLKVELDTNTPALLNAPCIDEIDNEKFKRENKTNAYSTENSKQLYHLYPDGFREGPEKRKGCYICYKNSGKHSNTRLPNCCQCARYVCAKETCAAVIDKIILKKVTCTKCSE